MTDKPIKHYTGQDVDVTWDGRLCIHVAECVRAEGEVFENGRKPWCNPDIANKDYVRDIVERCPSGALSYQDKSGAPEPAPSENLMIVAEDGPLLICADVAISDTAIDTQGITRRAALCRCGHSANKPFCDNSHARVHFTDKGDVQNKGEGLTALDGLVAIKPLKDGPLLVKGNLTIYANNGVDKWQGANTALCRCGHSENKPFCDGSHAKVDFKST